MSLKDKILKKIADRLKEYRTPEYDKILALDIRGEMKGAFMTTDCTTVKEISNKSKKGTIDVTKLLEEELDMGNRYHYREITFCDKDNIVCIYNSKNNSYYEDVHESFENAEERVYIKCDNNSIYETFKNYINQSSKYHDLVKYEYDIPRKAAFNKLFTEEVVIDNDVNEITNKKTYDNYIRITGKVSNIGKEFTKKDGNEAKFIEIDQEYFYNGKRKVNKISSMIEWQLFDEIEEMELGDTISITGSLSTYNDKDDNLKTIVNIYDIDILNKEKSKEKDGK